MLLFCTIRQPPHRLYVHGIHCVWISMSTRENGRVAERTGHSLIVVSSVKTGNHPGRKPVDVFANSVVINASCVYSVVSEHILL